MSKELNLVPQIKVNAKGGVSSKKTILITVVALLISVGGSIGYVFGSTVYYNSKLEKLKIEQEKSKSKVEIRNKINEEIALTEKQIKKADQLREVKKNDTDELIKIMRAEILVDGNTIDTMDYWGKNIEGHENEVALAGTAKSKDALQKAWANLRETPGYEKSQLEKWELKEKDGVYEYKMKISFEGGSEDEAK